jgi:hypothetical protein
MFNILILVEKATTLFYNNITKFIQRELLIGEGEFSKRYYLLYFVSNKITIDNLGNEEPLIAIPDYYFGVGVWTPHISILEINPKNSNNPIINQALMIGSTGENEYFKSEVRYLISQNVNYDNLEFKINEDTISNIILE